MRRAPYIGLLGGSFDPIHRRHVQLAKVARDALGLDSVHLIPAAMAWQKGEASASAEHRVRMVSLAIEGIPGLELDRIELDRGGSSYTIDTLRALLRRFPSRYVWILGADQLANFCTWHDWEDIAGLVDLAVAPRPDCSTQAPEPLARKLQQLGKTLLWLPLEAHAVASSDIRARIRSGQDIDDLVPEPVSQYIHTHQLYR